MDQIAQVLAIAHEIKHGPFSNILFRTHRRSQCSYLDYTRWYKCVTKEISLFAHALRQCDFLSEYLAYYRIIESVAGDNGKTWIAQAIDKIKLFECKKIYIVHMDDDVYSPTNLICIYKRRAIQRLKLLKNTYPTNIEIAKYLYNIMRCGIAHGKSDIVRGEIARPYFEVANDTFILKVLARMAIEEKRRASQTQE